MTHYLILPHLTYLPQLPQSEVMTSLIENKGDKTMWLTLWLTLWLTFIYVAHVAQSEPQKWGTQILKIVKIEKGLDTNTNQTKIRF